MKYSMKNLALTFFCLAVSSTAAADYDGSKALICATIEARDCVLSSECFTGEAKVVGAPAFFRLDFEKKTLHGPERTSEIASIEKTPTSLLLYGSEIGYGWVIGINQKSGDFSASITNHEGAFLLFGSCTVL